jgi:hypothetical protein
VLPQGLADRPAHYSRSDNKQKVTALYECWQGIIKRATNPNSQDFEDYMGRGITVHPEWTGEGGFQAFEAYVLEHLGPHPGEGWSIDRRNNNGSYVPGNIRWADRSTQATNKRKRKGCSSQYLGVCWRNDNQKWRAGLTVNGSRIHLGTFSLEEDAARAVNSAILLYKTGHPLQPTPSSFASS